MSLLDQFSSEQRRIFESTASVLEIPRGQYLIRRGDPSGDLFLLRRGTLEVVESRRVPEVILSVLEPGAVVGDVAFLDDSPRSADVRAARPAEVLRWARDDLRMLLQRHPAVAAAFYEHVARTAAARLRSATHNALTSGRAAEVARHNTAGLSRVREEAHRIAESTKESLLDAETRLRHDAADPDARLKVRAILDWLQGELHQLFAGHLDTEDADEAARVLCRELHPYLVRSALAERCIRRPQGVCASPEILAHVLVDAANGDGQLGELLDRWLLDRPMLRATREGREPLLRLVTEALPRHRNRRVLLVNAGTGSLVARMLRAFAQPPTLLTILDQSRDALAFLDPGVAAGPRSVELQTVQENLAAFAVGRCRHRFAPQDAIVLHGLLEYMPDRIAISLLGVIRRVLAPGGVVAVQALRPSTDQALFAWLLAWPTVRRTTEASRRLFAAAGFDVEWSAELADPAQVLVARARAAARVSLPEPAGVA